MHHQPTAEATLLPSCTVPGPPHVHHLKADPSQELELLLWLFSAHSAAGPAWVLSITISHLCCGKSRGKSQSRCFLQHNYTPALTAAGPLKIRSLDAQELTWCVLWQISVYAAVCPCAQGGQQPLESFCRRYEMVATPPCCCPHQVPVPSPMGSTVPCSLLPLQLMCG